MALPWLAVVSAMAMSYMAAAQTIPQLVPGFKATPGFTVSTDITTLTTSGQFVTVSWTGNPSPKNNDAIALYVLAPNVTVDTLSPFKFQWINRSPGAATSGSGSLKFQVWNQRYPAVFLYFSDITSVGFGNVAWNSKKVVAVSNPIAVTPNEPTQGHLTFTANQGEVSVQWTTRDVGTPVIKFGTSPGQYGAPVPANSGGYTRDVMCGTPANTYGYFEPGSMHYGTITGLAPDTTYYYTYGDAALNLFAPEASFVTPPLPSAADKIHFIAWADAGQANADDAISYDYYTDYDDFDTSPYGTEAATYWTAYDVWEQEQATQPSSLKLVERLLDEVKTFKPTLAINNGDISYARGSVAQWDNYFEQYKPLYRQLPVMSLPGNHERDWPNTGDRFYPLQSRSDSGGECGIAYQQRLRMPTANITNEWFVVADLKKVDRSKTPWVIVGFHRPIYTTSLEGVTLASDLVVANDLRDAYEQIFYQYEVDLTLSGHVHLYARTCPVLRKGCLGYNKTTGAPNAPIHLSIGNGGYAMTWFVNHDTPSYFDEHILEHGYIRAEVDATSLHITAIATETGKVMDDFTIKKAANYMPDMTARNNFLYSGYQPDYKPTFLEDPGLSPDTIFFNLFFMTALAPDLKNDHALLASLANATFVVNPNTEDNVPRLSQIFDAYAKILRRPSFLKEKGITDPQAAAKFIYKAFLPLFSQFDKNVIAAQLNPSVDPNVLKDQNTATIQKAVDPLNIVQEVTAKLDNVPPLVFQQEAAPAPAP
ncbi:g10559 [Coccomyxa elongata]